MFIFHCNNNVFFLKNIKTNFRINKNKLIEINHSKIHFDFNCRRSCSSLLINKIETRSICHHLNNNCDRTIIHLLTIVRVINNNSIAISFKKFITLTTRKTKKIIFLIRKNIKKIIITTRFKMISRTNISIKTTFIKIMITRNNNRLSKKHKITSSTYRRNKFVFLSAIVAMSNFISTTNYIDISKFVNRNLLLLLVIKTNQ